MSCDIRARIVPIETRGQINASFGGDVTCANGTVIITNTEDTELYSVPVASGGTAGQVIPDQTAQGTTGLGAIFFPAGTTGTIPDVEYTDTDGSPATAPYGSAIACSAAADGTVEIKNSADTLLYTVEVGSGDTEEQVIPDQTAQGTTGQGAITFPANTVGTIPDVDYTDTDGTSKSTPYGSALACQTMTEAIQDSTTSEVVTAIQDADKECSVRKGLLDLVFNDGIATIGEIGSIGSQSFGCFVTETQIYLTNRTTINIYDVNTFAFIATVSGFNYAVKIITDDTNYYVSDFDASLIRTLSLSTNLPVSTFPTSFKPFSLIYIGGLLYTSPYNTGGGVRIYDTAGTLQNTITGFDSYIFDMAHDNIYYYVLHGGGVSSGNSVKVRKMNVSDNTEADSYTLGTVSTIGIPQGITISNGLLYISTNLNAGAVIYEFDTDLTLLRTSLTGVYATNSWGLCTMPGDCNKLLATYASLGFAKLIVP